MPPFSIDVRINHGSVIRINGERLEGPQDGECLYRYRAIADRKVVNGRVVHNRPDGIVTLARKILEDIEGPHADV